MIFFTVPLLSNKNCIKNILPVRHSAGQFFVRLLAPCKYLPAGCQTSLCGVPHSKGPNSPDAFSSLCWAPRRYFLRGVPDLYLLSNFWRISYHAGCWTVRKMKKTGFTSIDWNFKNFHAEQSALNFFLTIRGPYLDPSGTVPLLHFNLFNTTRHILYIHNYQWNITKLFFSQITFGAV